MTWPLLRRCYYPQWGDEKDRQGIRSASLHQFGADHSDEILIETFHRQQRTGSPGRPVQPWPEASRKVWQRFARQLGNAALAKHLA